jgi:hypothetical protein
MTDREPVGTLAQEAAKLFAVVQSWVGETPGRSGDAAGSGEQGEVASEDRAEAWSGAPDEPAGHEPTECQWCPLCRAVRMAKATSPDVRDHLSQAALSLALAVKGLLDDPVTSARRETPLEKIDLTEE